MNKFIETTQVIFLNGVREDHNPLLTKQKKKKVVNSHTEAINKLNGKNVSWKVSQ